MGETESREQILKEKAALDAERLEMKKRHRKEEADSEKKLEALQERCGHPKATGGPGLWACPDCEQTEFYREE